MTLTRKRLRDAFHAMWRRCRNPKHEAYPRYGGRGIKVCDRWRSFKNFIADMGERPPGMTLDRIDNNGDYTPENCRWATLHEQARNTRQNVFVTHEGKTMCVADWARELGINPQRIRHRLNQGWPVEAALTVRTFHRHNAPRT